jgi:hypothetical protein
MKTNMVDTRLPSFIVVGPPRTGTTWLYKVLSPYTRLPTPTNEIRFFDLHFHRGFEWYLSHFEIESGKGPMGEVAPTYFASALARQRIAESIPNVKLIFIFRDPVQRVVSLYRMKRAYGMIPWEFEEALEKDVELISSGMYATQFSEWRRMFPAEQMLVTIYEDLCSEPQEFINSITSFIDIPPITLDKATLGRVFPSEKMTKPRSYYATRAALAFADWCKARKLDQLVISAKESALIKLFLGGGDPLTDASPVALQRLGETLRPEVEGLEMFLGRRLEAWRINE